MNIIDLSSGTGECKKVKVDSFSKKYLPVTDIALAKSISQAILHGAEYVLVDVALIKDLDKKLAEHKKSELMLHETARLNNMGMEAEKDGRIFDALEVYERNIALGGRALHAYERLRILYHKAKDYENEIRVIKRMIEVYEINPTDESNWWVKRIAKVEAALNKAAQKKQANPSTPSSAPLPDEPINIFWTE